VYDYDFPVQNKSKYNFTYSIGLSQILLSINILLYNCRLHPSWLKQNNYTSKTTQFRNSYRLYDIAYKYANIIKMLQRCLLGVRHLPFKTTHELLQNKWPRWVDQTTRVNLSALRKSAVSGNQAARRNRQTMSSDSGGFTVFRATFFFLPSEIIKCR